MSTSSDYRKAGQGAQHGARKPNLGKEEYDCKNEVMFKVSTKARISFFPGLRFFGASNQYSEE